MKILFVSSEVEPFSKTGGLGDVCGALPKALAKRGHRVVTASPCYQGSAKADFEWEVRGTFWFWLFGEHHEARFIVAEESPNLAHVLISNPMFDRGGIYGDHNGVFGDNQLRYALLSRAAMEIPRVVPVFDGELLGEVDILHAHDWQGALAPVFLNGIYKPVGVYPGTRSVLTIHNAAHQATFDIGALGGLDLSARHTDTMRHGGRLNTLKGGIVSADHVTAVSPTFAEELMGPEGGFGLDGIFRGKRAEGKFSGILNGIDEASWDPATDKALLHHFDRSDLSGKRLGKGSLQLEMGLPVSDDVPLFGIVSRLDWQKGIELLVEGAESIFSGHPLQFVILGSGDPKIHDDLQWLQRTYGDRVRVRLDKDFPLARRIFAASDFIVVPSLFEPCGLTQMYAMRYGAAPVVRATGGLRDSVESWDPATGRGVGWSFEAYSPHALAEAIGWAAHTWHAYPEAYTAVQQNGMSVDWSWAKAAQGFEDLYKSLNPAS